MLRIAISILISLATFGLAFGFASRPAWPGVAASVAWGGLWWIGWRRNLTRTISPGLIGVVSLAAFGVWWNLSPFWMLASVIAALVAWDLMDFSQRLARISEVKGEFELRQAHLRRVFSVASLGFVLGGMALSLRVELTLGWAIFLGLLTILGLSQVVGFIRGR